MMTMRDGWELLALSHASHRLSTGIRGTDRPAAIHAQQH